MSVDLTRSADLYLTFGFSPRERLGRELGLACILKMLKTMASVTNLRRAPGDAGQLKLIARPNGFSQYMTPDLSQFTPFPTSKFSDVACCKGVER